MMGTTVWRKEMPEFLQFLEQKLNYRVRGRDQELGFELYAVDLSGWKLRFSERTTLIHLKVADLTAHSSRNLAQMVADVLHARSLSQRSPILLIDGDGDTLREALRLANVSTFTLDQADQTAIRESRRPSGEMLDRLIVQVPLSLLSPYETSRPVTGSRFFGRESEIRRVLTSVDSNFAIVGIRRIGKTSLLKEIGERMGEFWRDRNDEAVSERIIFMDCNTIKSPSHFMQEVVRKLQPRELARLENRQFPLFFPDFLNRMSRWHNGTLVFLLDEFDALLLDQVANKELLDVLRASSNMGSARFIVAGFRELLHETSNQNSPVFNFVKTLRLQELTRNEAASLILQPMESLRVRLERRNEIVDRIFDETAGQPNLIQFYCSILIDQLDRAGGRTITPEDLFGVHENEELRGFLVNTFMDNTTNLEKAIVFAAMTKHFPGKTGFDLETIDAALADYQIVGPFLDIEHACQNLTLAGTFTRQGQHYHFATPIFPRILGENYNVEYLLRKVLQEGIW